MQGYGKAAVKAARLIAEQPGTHPRAAWNSAVNAEFPHSHSLREKACPRACFLGLCQAGMVDAVARGNYTTSFANSAYALKALDLLAADSSLCESPEKLWRAVIGTADKRHNSQMDVVTALWKAKLVR